MSSLMGMTGKLGDILLSLEWIARADLREATAPDIKLPGERLGDTLLRLGLVTDERLREALAIQYGLPYLRVTSRLIDRAIEDALPKSFIQKNRVIPLFRVERELTVAVDDPTNLLLIDDITRLSGCDVLLVVTTSSVINSYLEDMLEDHLGAFEIDDFVDDTDEGDELRLIEEEAEDLLDLEEVAGMSPVVRLVNYILYRAIKDRASDVHIEPDEQLLRIRCRVDGDLVELMTPPLRMHAAVVSRVKVMTDLDISERRKPQDGRFRVMVTGRPVDVRVSTMPTVQGEKVVMRLLDRSSMRIDLGNLGMGHHRFRSLTELIHRPNGLILVTGPTGSGKTTTLYAMLEEITAPEKNVCTVENPVEFNIRGVSQVQVSPKGGVGFPDALRSLLRQDPDVIMIGEIRDHETATIAVQASLTGHLVMATLHTNDAVSAVTRLINMGIEPYLISAALRGVVSQRLVRRLCPSCRQKTSPTKSQIIRLDRELPEGQFCTKRGCDKCGNAGFTGRIGLYEVLSMTDELADLITASPSLSELRSLAHREGLLSLMDDGIRKASEGITSLDEMMRVVWT